MRVDGRNSYYCGFGVQTAEGERVRMVMWLDTDMAVYYQAAEPFQVHRSGDIAGALFQVDRIEIDGARNLFVLHGEHRRVQAGDLEYESWFQIADPAPIANCGTKPCTPGRHCERHARGLGACVAGHCYPPAAANQVGEMARIEALQRKLRIGQDELQRLCAGVSIEKGRTE